MIMPKGKFGKAIEVLVWIAGLLMTLLATLVISSAPAFAGSGCTCLDSKCVLGGKGACGPAGCQFDKNTLQCVNVNCKGLCI